MTEEANNIVANLEGLVDRRSIVLYNEEWHKGVIGIVASRLTEVYYRPAVVLTRTDDMATGSARSVSGFDVYKAIEHCRDLLENFGGHTYAAGLSMKVENVNAFTKRFEEYVSQHILPEQTSAVIEIDAEIDFRDISSKFFSDRLILSVLITRNLFSALIMFMITEQVKWWDAIRNISNSNWSIINRIM